MKNIKNNISILLLTLACSQFAMAQGGSNYSLFGIGDMTPAIGAQFKGLNGTSIAFPEELGINTVNPAMWSTVVSTRLQIGYSFNQHLNTTEGKDLLQNNGKLSGIQGIFSIDTSMGIAASFGIIPFSNVNFKVANPFVINNANISFSGRTVYSGIGGLNKAYIGGASNIYGGLSVGASLFAVFGKTEYNSETYFFDEYYYTANNNTKEKYSGAGYSLGMYFEGPYNLNFGAYYETFNSVSVTSDLTYTSDLVADTSFRDVFDFNLPAAYGFGLSHKTGKFILGADVAFRNFSDLEYRKFDNSEFGENTRISVGVSRLGNKSAGADFLDEITYRVGAGYQNMYYKVNQRNGTGKTAISEYSLSFGMSMPLPGTAFMDAALQIGSRGTTENGLIREYFARLSVDLSIGETWFKPFRRGF